MPGMIKSTSSFTLPINFVRNKSYLEMQDSGFGAKEEEAKMESWVA